MLRTLKSIPPVTKNLLIINILVWFAMAVYTPLDAVVKQYLGLHFYESDSFNLVQPVTYMFVHCGFIHLLFNMITLFFFGSPMEYTFGSKRFLLYYMVCGVGAALIQEAVWSFTLYGEVVDGLARRYLCSTTDIKHFLALNPDILQQYYDIFVTVGASGAIYGLLLAFGMLYPDRPVYFMFLPVPIKAKWMVLIWGGMELLLGMRNATDGIAHFAHLGGMIFGFMLITYWLKKGQISRY